MHSITGDGMTKLVEIRCTCGKKGKMLGKVQEGAAHEHKCSRCGAMIAGIAVGTDAIKLSKCGYPFDSPMPRDLDINYK